MARVFRADYTRPLPPDARVTRSGAKRHAVLTIAGEPRRCEVREVNGRLRAVVPCAGWSIEYTAADGSTRREAAGPDKRIAQTVLAARLEREARLRLGLADHSGEAAARHRPLADLVREYLAVLEGRDTTTGYRAVAKIHLDAIRVGCRWLAWSDVTADSLTVFLGRMRDRPVRPPGPATLNGYLRTAKAFCNWYADRLQVRSPLKGVSPYPEQKDRRRSRRILTEDEFARLLEATTAAPRRFNTIIRPADRAMLYLVAGLTGLRASELARLTAASFDLDAGTAVVLGKDKLEDTVTLPGHLVDRLRVWLAGRPPRARLWPGKWAEHRHQVHWLQRDARRAGLGDGVTFHGLRRRYVTQLVRAGNDLDVVRRMSRHKDLSTTMNYYTVHTDADLRRAAESLLAADPLAGSWRKSAPQSAPECPRSAKTFTGRRGPKPAGGAKSLGRKKQKTPQI